MFATIFNDISTKYVDLTEAEIEMQHDADLGERASFIIAQTVCVDVVLYQTATEKLYVAQVFMTGDDHHVYNLTCGGDLNGVDVRQFHIDDFAQFIQFIADLMLKYHSDQV